MITNVKWQQVTVYSCILTEDKFLDSDMTYFVLEQILSLFTCHCTTRANKVVSLRILSVGVELEILYAVANVALT